MVRIRLIILLLLTTISYYTYAQSAVDTSALGALKWRNIGPWRAGRSCTVTGIPGDPNTFLFGSSGGGVWKTVDGGNQWMNISDGYFGGSIGAVAIAPSDPNVIYVGQGEQTLRGNVSAGAGVWKSEDGGMTWRFLGLKETYHIARIRIHPDNPDIVYISAIGNLWRPNPMRGIFKTTDGGQSWTKVLYLNDSTAAADLALDPNNPRILYASMWNVRRTPYSFSSGGPNGGLWKSIDSGKTWTEITHNKGLPKGLWGLSGIAPSKARPGRVWAIVENIDGGVFRSDDYGKTWTKINSNRSLRQRAWYYSRIYADPANPDMVYVLNVRFHRSKDGGKTFQTMGTPHGDHHDLWIDPANPMRMIVADDGGAQVSRDGGENWTTYHNQPTAQFYRVTVDNHFPFRIYAAQQDNSAIRIFSQSYGSSLTEKDWESTAGGESAYLAVDPKDNDIVYGGSYGGFLTRFNHHNKRNRAVHVWPDNPLGAGVEVMKYRFNWNYPIFFSPHSPNKLYAASNQLHLSTDEGQTWKTISPDLTTNDTSKQKSSGGPITKDNTAVEYYCTITTAAESPAEEGVLWTGSDDGKVYISRDHGTNWEDVSPPQLPAFTLINSIEPSPASPGSCFIAATRYKWGDNHPYLLKTKDYGRTWISINRGISPEDFTRVVRQDHAVPNLLFAGTEHGLYLSWDEGNNWIKWQSNLPIVPITDMIIKEDALVVATQGRALWVLDDLTPIRLLPEFTGRQTSYLFPPKITYRMPGGRSPHPRNAGENPPSGAMIYYHIATDSLKKTDTVVLEFLTRDLQPIRRFSTHSKDKNTKLNAEAGANLFVWDMRSSPAKKFKNMIMWWGSLRGPRILPGEYSVRLLYRGDTLAHPLVVQADPNTEATLSDMEAQKAFIEQNNGALDRAHQTITSIRDIRSQMKDLLLRLRGHEDYPALDSMYQQIDSTCTAVENALYQTKLKSAQDPLNFPIKLNNKLAHLNALIEMNDFGPTASMAEVSELLIDSIDREVEKFNSVIKAELQQFNQFIIDHKVNIIRPIKEKEQD